MPQVSKAASKALELVKKGSGGCRLLVIGDLILDRFVYGAVERISPEAPVPVVDVERMVARPGGATNVVRNLLSMGAEVSVAGVVGSDPAARELKELLTLPGCGLDGVVFDDSRPTAVKTRVIAQHQQVVRFDHESLEPLSRQVMEELVERIDWLSSGCAAVIVSDYGKAVVSGKSMEMVRSLGLPFAVDPKPRNAGLYGGAAVITPNTRETYEMCGIKPSTDDDARAAGMNLMERYAVGSVLVTRGERGMTLVDKGGKARHIPTRARDVFDVTGAGDTSISLYALATACGAKPYDAACLANLAGGIVVGKLGTATVTVEELERALEEEPQG